MREFKFRAFNKLNKKIYPCAGFLSGQVVIIKEDGQTLGCKDDDWEIQQYTGLTDKNGKEIYEGDIVYCFFANRPTEENVGIVEFCLKYGNVGIKIIKNNIYVSTMDIPKPFFNFITNEGQYLIEVIGNIFENPELLNVS